MSKEPKTALDFVGRYMSQVVTDSGHQAEVVAVKRPLFRCVQLNLVSKHRVSAGELAGISVNGIRLITNVVNGTMAMKIHDLEVGPDVDDQCRKSFQ